MPILQQRLFTNHAAFVKQVETAQTFGLDQVCVCLCCMFGSQGTNTAAVAVAADPHRHRCLGCFNVKPATETASKSFDMFDSCLIHV